MKIKSVIIKILFNAFILVACAPATILISTKTVTPSQTSTPVLPTLTSTPAILWSITATPLNLPSSNNDEIVSIIDQLHPVICIRNLSNYAILTPPPTGLLAHYPELKFTEVSILPNTQPGDISERADNVDHSRTAFVITVPYVGQNLYIKDNITGKIFQDDYGPTHDVLWVYWLQWLNKDTIFFTLQGHSITFIIVINVKKQRYEYYAAELECPTTPTP
jgi:hypothetical protein